MEMEAVDALPFPFYTNHSSTHGWWVFRRVDGSHQSISGVFAAPVLVPNSGTYICPMQGLMSTYRNTATSLG